MRLEVVLDHFGGRLYEFQAMFERLEECHAAFHGLLGPVVEREKVLN